MPSLVTESPAMQNVLQVISRVGPSDANVLIPGENGTGKVSSRARCTACPAAPRGRWSW